MPCDNTIAVVPAVIQVTESITCVANKHFSVLSFILFEYLGFRGFITQHLANLDLPCASLFLDQKPSGSTPP